MSTDEPTPRRSTRRWQRALGPVASLVLLILILVGVIPQFASYSSAWTRITHLDTWSWVAIVAAATVNQISGIWPYQAAMPGLRFWQGLLQIETATAISNTVPAGGAVAIGVTYRMFSSFGFADVVISSAVVTTGIWNLAAKFVLPVAAIGLLAITEPLTTQVVGAALTGVVALVVLAVRRGWCSGLRRAPAGSAASVTVSSTGWAISSTSHQLTGSSALWSTSAARPSKPCAGEVGFSPRRRWPIRRPGSFSSLSSFGR